MALSPGITPKTRVPHFPSATAYDRHLGVLGLCAIFLACPFLSAQQQKAFTSKVPASFAATAADASELRAALTALDSANRSGDASPISAAARHVIALALRQIGDLRFTQHNSREAVELYGRSLAFEDLPKTRKRLQIAQSPVRSGASETTRESTGTTAPRETAREQELAKILAIAFNGLGANEARQQSYSLAMNHFHEAERWNPDTPGLMRNIGMAAVRLSDYPEAVRALRPVVAAAPGDKVARSVLAMSQFATSAFAEAVQTFTPLGDAVWDQPELAYAWAASLVKINKYPDATALLDKLEKQQLPSETWILVAQSWSQMGNYPRTVDACHKALVAYPKLLGAHYLAGLALIRQDNPAEATQEFRSELQLDPGNTDSEYHLAFVLLQQSQNQEAVEWLHKVLAAKPDHPEANYELGKELLRTGKPAEAIPYLEAAARLRPELEPVHYQLQSAYRAVGQKDDADREAKIYRDLKAKSRNITLPAPPGQKTEPARPE